MKTIATFALALGALGFAGLAGSAEDKKKDAGDGPKLDGKYTLVSGKKNGVAIDEEAKKGKYKKVVGHELLDLFFAKAAV